jgi:hypothetical protein
MRRSINPVHGIVAATAIMLVLAVPSTIAQWDHLRAGGYSRLWWIWPMVLFGTGVIAVSAWRAWRARGDGKDVTAPASEGTEE